MKSLIINQELHKKFKLFCIENDFKINATAEKALEAFMETIDDKKGKEIPSSLQNDKSEEW